MPACSADTMHGIRSPRPSKLTVKPTSAISAFDSETTSKLPRLFVRSERS